MSENTLADNTGVLKEALPSAIHVALITGGGNGIGRSTAIKFSEQGYRCAVADINIESALETVHMLKNPAIAIEVDVCDDKSVQEMINSTVKSYGRIDCAFNNAGIEGVREKTANYPEEMFDRVLNTNLKGIWLCLKYEIIQMMKQDLIISNPEKWKDKSELCRFTGARGNIVNTSSTAGLGAMPEFLPYCASKWAIIGLTKTAAKEYAKDGIRINAICPATTDTPMRSRFQGQWPEWQSQTDECYPVGRVAAPEEVAEAVYWLCTDSCPFVTGEYLKIGGGL